MQYQKLKVTSNIKHSFIQNAFGPFEIFPTFNTMLV